MSGGLTDVEMSGATVQLAGSDGNFEFEHSPASESTQLAAQMPDGSPTPLVIGTADGQDVTPLIVRGDQAMSSDIQAWQAGDRTVAAIGPQGQLSLDGIVVEAVVRGTTIVLEAVLPNGTTQLLVPRRTRL
ncbi:MAG TPA: hypothetical protein VFM96_00335 [Gaiellaceae bacterium]|nr:hypothetical protein [Gaiellaceae bacterium]